MCRLEPFLKRSLVVLLFLGLAEACIPREVVTEEKIKLLKGILGLMGRLSPDGFRQNIKSSSSSSSSRPPLVTTPDKSEEEIKILKRILGLLSLQVLNEETSNCKEEVKPPPATTTARGLVRSSGWNFLRCAYMVMTFLFVSYNKGDWCYCHYCNPDLDLRDDPCCSF
uniref:epididymal protein 13 isoform X1 n=1 Tax=Arvicanthis niloticus TaxID=61156 RepID=UPI001487073D|nr:epididymal protein 13 isoform X1 [Arvicanthis niloticus]